MSKYRAIISIEFDDEDLGELAAELGVSASRMDPTETIGAELDALSIGCALVEQLFQDGEPTIARLSPGLEVTINPHN